MATVTTVTYDSTSDTNAITLTLASLATSSTMVAGRESTAISNATTKYMDAIVSGQITTGTTPTTAKTIAIYVYAALKLASSTPTYPIATTTALTGSDAAATFEVEQRNQLRFARAISINATSDRAYAIMPFSVAALFGGVMPLRWGLWVTHDTGVNLNSTAGNHWMHYRGITYTNT